MQCKELLVQLCLGGMFFTVSYDNEAGYTIHHFAYIR
jgi:hypothetical protein